MTQALLAETLLVSQQVFKGRFLDIRSDTVQLPSGKSGTREYFVHPGVRAD